MQLPAANVMASTKLRAENTALKEENEKLRSALAECQAQRDMSTIASMGVAGAVVDQAQHRQAAETRALVAENLLKNTSNIEDLFKENERLSQENKELKDENAKLKKEIDELRATIKKHEETITKHETVLNRLLERENLITAREAARSLEWFVCVDAQKGDWKKAFKDTRNLALVESAGLPLPPWMDEHILNCLRKMKGDGDDVVHDRSFTEADVEEAFKAGDQSTLPAKMKMLEELKKFYASHKIPFGTPIDRTNPPKS